MTKIQLYKPKYYAEVFNFNSSGVERYELQLIDNDNDFNKLCLGVMKDGNPLRIGNRYIKSSIVRSMYKEEFKNDVEYLLTCVPTEIKINLNLIHKQLIEIGKQPTIKLLWNTYRVRILKLKPNDFEYTVDTILGEIDLQNNP